MAYGRPVVASAVGGLLDSIEDAVTGRFVPPGDPAALRTALEELLADAALRHRLGTSARQAAANRFSWEAATETTIAAYRAALS
jgi:glycosyltransferase involved in cell wall biosynthesis